MLDQIQLNIANLFILINSTQFPILHEREPAYRAFIRNGCRGKKKPDIEIDLQLGSPPDFVAGEKIFEDEEAWLVFRHGHEYFLCYSPPQHGENPLWVARFQKDCNQVIVYCSKKLFHQGDGGSSLISPIRYPLDQHLIMYHLAQVQGVLIHAAGWKMVDKSFLFLGRSGAGKSTISRLFSGKENWQGLSDDRILVRKMAQVVRCYGTPWPGEEGLAVNADAELSGLFFLCQDTRNKITSLNPRQALKRLLPVVSIPWYDQETCLSIMQFCEDLLSHIPAFELSFKPTLEVVDIFEEFVVAETGLEIIEI
jgi:hypothetical protein